MSSVDSHNPSSIREMFGVISKKYDLANSVLSFGIHHSWKKTLIKKSELKTGDRILDCATGTGDLAFYFEKALHGTGAVIGSDFCEPMLDIARSKAIAKKSSVHFQTADVMNLPFKDHEFNVASISFGIRNVKDTQQALQELGRVVKPGGRVMVLEFGQPKFKLMEILFNFYSSWILPTLGGWISGQRQAYQYLQTSSATYPCGEKFLKIAKETGRFQKMSAVPFQTGIAFLYILEV